MTDAERKLAGELVDGLGMKLIRVQDDLKDLIARMGGLVKLQDYEWARMDLDPLQAVQVLSSALSLVRQVRSR